MSKIQFNITAENIAAEVANLEAQGIFANQSKHIVLVPAIESTKMVGGKEVELGQAYIEQVTKDLSLFFPVVAVAQKVSGDTQRIGQKIEVGNEVFSARVKPFQTLHPTILKTVTEGTVYALIEDYDVDIVKAGN